MPVVFLPALADIAIAGICLICLVAIAFLLEAIANALGGTPVIGGWISTELRGLAGAVQRAGTRIWDGGMHGLEKMWDTMYHWGHDFLSGIVGYIQTEAASLHRLWVSYIPQLHAALDRDINSVQAKAESYALSHINSLAATVNKDIATVTSLADSLFNQAVARIDTVRDTLDSAIAAGIATAETEASIALSAATARLLADVAQAEQLARSEVASLDASVQAALGNLTHAINAGLATAESLATAGIAAARAGIYTDLESWGDQAVSQVWPDAEGDINALRQTLGGDFPWLNDLLGALGGLGTVGLLGALTRAIAGTEAITKLANDCIVPNCRNLSQFGADLKDLLGLASTASLLAWCTFMVTDPNGWAQETYTAANDVVTATIDATQSLLGAS